MEKLKEVLNPKESVDILKMVLGCSWEIGSETGFHLDMDTLVTLGHVFTGEVRSYTDENESMRKAGCWDLVT